MAEVWRIRFLSDMLNDTYAKFYSPSEHLAVNEFIVLFKGRVVLKQYIPKKQTFWYKGLHTLRHNWLHLRHEHILGKG
jgi:hypothetical protein